VSTEPRARALSGEVDEERSGLFNYAAGKLLKGHKVQKAVSIDKPQLRCGLQ
jgi:hypothetical protein